MRSKQVGSGPWAQARRPWLEDEGLWTRFPWDLYVGVLWLWLRCIYHGWLGLITWLAGLGCLACLDSARLCSHCNKKHGVVAR